MIVKEYFSCSQAKELIGHVERVEHMDHLDDIVNLESISSMKIDTLESNIFGNIVERNDYMNFCDLSKCNSSKYFLKLSSYIFIVIRHE